MATKSNASAMSSALKKFNSADWNGMSEDQVRREFPTYGKPKPQRVENYDPTVTPSWYKKGKAKETAKKRLASKGPVQ